MAQTQKNLIDSTLIRYALTGGVTTVADYLSFALLALATDMFLTAHIFGKIVGATVSFILHWNFTFNVGEGTKWEGKFAAYFALLAINLLLSSALFEFVNAYIDNVRWISRAIIDVLVILWTYYVSKTLLFRSAQGEKI